MGWKLEDQSTKFSLSSVEREPMWDGNIMTGTKKNFKRWLSENQCGMETDWRAEAFYLGDLLLSENQCGMETCKRLCCLCRSR